MRHCSKCVQDKPDDAFYPAQKTECKECTKARVRARARSNPAVQAYDRERAKRPEKKAKIQANAKAWRQAHPVAYRAQNAVNNALRDGRITRPSCCQQCGSTARLHAHHDDYSKPLDVRWLCALCHHRWHADHPEIDCHQQVAHAELAFRPLTPLFLQSGDG